MTPANVNQTTTRHQSKVLQTIDSHVREVSPTQHLMQQMVEVTDDIACLPIVFVNVYFVGAPGEKWFVVDSGLRGFEARIIAAAESRYGKNATPEAVILTHGHFDHAGSARALAEHWNVPIYAHRLEMPFLTGRDYFPPTDPTVGGFLALLARAFPKNGTDLRPFIQELPADERMPGFPEWQVIHTPGHTNGHVSLFRAADRALIAGDALATINQNSAVAMLTNKQSVNGPPPPVTTDWTSARASAQVLSELNPAILACGHGAPITDENLAAELRRFAAHFDERALPAHGRYINEPAVTNEQGVVSLPPPVADPTGKALLGVGLAAIAGITLATLWNNKRKKAQQQQHSHNAKSFVRTRRKLTSSRDSRQRIAF